MVKPRCDPWVLSKAAAGSGHFRAGHQGALPSWRPLGWAAALAPKRHSPGMMLQSVLQARWWHVVTMLFSLCSLPKGFFYFSLAYSSSLPSIDYVHHHHKICKILQKKKIIHGSQDISKCCLKPNTSPDSETLSVVYYITLSHESKGEHFRVSCWKAFLVCACSVSFF